MPALFHVQEVTQPLGHSTSGSHERYKSKDRLAWEKEFDCISQFKKWILATGKADEAQLKDIENRASKRARQARDTAWKHYTGSYKAETDSLAEIVQQIRITSYNVCYTKLLRVHLRLP